jgi:hypothetical protein
MQVRPAFLEIIEKGCALIPRAHFVCSAALPRAHGAPRPACGERATRQERKPELGSVRGRFHELRLAVGPPHPPSPRTRGEGVKFSASLTQLSAR